MMKKKKTVLDERELLELYKIEHRGLWLMYSLLCVSILVQLILGAEIVQMAGEIAAMMITSIVMIIANARHGIWSESSRPSVRDNAAYSLGAGVLVAALCAAVGRDVGAALATGACTGVLCMAVLSLLMAYMQRRQKKQETELEDE